MHRLLAPIAFCLLLAAQVAHAGPAGALRAVTGAGMDPAVMTSLFEESRKEKKGLTVFLPGHTIAIVVTAVHGPDTVEGRNQEYQRVLIRVDQILALAFQ